MLGVENPSRNEKLWITAMYLLSICNEKKTDIGILNEDGIPFEGEDFYVLDFIQEFGQVLTGYEVQITNGVFHFENMPRSASIVDLVKNFTETDEKWKESICCSIKHKETDTSEIYTIVFWFRRSFLNQSQVVILNKVA